MNMNVVIPVAMVVRNMIVAAYRCSIEDRSRYPGESSTLAGEPAFDLMSRSGDRVDGRKGAFSQRSGIVSPET
jgi:hypothetical protein